MKLPNHFSISLDDKVPLSRSWVRYLNDGRHRRSLIGFSFDASLSQGYRASHASVRYKIVKIDQRWWQKSFTFYFEKQ